MRVPVDLVYVPGWVSNVELIWDDPYLSRFFRKLSSFARVITFDKRGTGLSDPVSVENLPDLETRMDDLRAVMDEVWSESATLASFRTCVRQALIAVSLGVCDGHWVSFSVLSSSIRAPTWRTWLHRVHVHPRSLADPTAPERSLAERVFVTSLARMFGGGGEDVSRVWLGLGYVK